MQQMTPEQWALIYDAPTMMAVGVAVLDGGVFAFSRKFVALTNFIARARQDYADNALVQRALDQVPDKDSIQQSPYVDPGQYNSLVFMELFGQIGALLAANTPEIVAYKQCLLALGEHIAVASGGGLFGTGKKLSEDERVFLLSAARALGMSYTPPA